MFVCLIDQYLNDIKDIRKVVPGEIKGINHDFNL